jgi:hypothetical protein
VTSVAIPLISYAEDVAATFAPDFCRLAARLRWSPFNEDPILEAISHGPRGDIVSVCTTFPWPVLCAEVSKLKIEPVGVRIPRGLVDKARYTAVTGEQSSRNRWTKRATPAGFETQVEPNLSADLHKGIERLQVPLGSDEITWRGQRSVRFGPKLAPEGWSAPTGKSARWGRWERRPRARARPDRSLS